MRWLIAEAWEFLRLSLHTVSFTLSLPVFYFIPPHISSFQPPSSYLTSLLSSHGYVLFPKFYTFALFFILFLFLCVGFEPPGTESWREEMILKWLREFFLPFEARCTNVAWPCWNPLFSPAAVSQRPTLAVRGEVVTMTASSQDSTPPSVAGLLLLLLLLPAAVTQNSAVPTTPTASLFDPLTQPECMKKEHPKVSIQGQTSLISTCLI